MCKLYVFILSMIICFACSQKINSVSDANLKDFRTGTYYYDTLGFHTELTRDSAVQIEKTVINNKAYKMVFNIYWESDSVYILEVTDSNMPGCLKIGDKLRSTITSVESNKIYAVKSYSKNCGSSSVTIIRQ